MAFGNIFVYRLKERGFYTVYLFKIEKINKLLKIKGGGNSNEKSKGD